MARKKPTRSGNAGRAKLLADQAVALADYAAKALAAAEQLQIKTKSVGEVPLEEDERVALAALPSLPARVRKKFARPDADFTVAEVASLLLAVAESFPVAEPNQQAVLLVIA